MHHSNLPLNVPAISLLLRRSRSVRHATVSTLIILITCVYPAGELAFAGDMPLVADTQLLDPDSIASGQFGTSVAIDNNVAVVGVPTAFVGNIRPGKAVVLARVAGEWVATATLVAGDVADLDLFGQSVTVSDNTIVVGAPRANVDFVPDQGAAYVFTRNPVTGQWTEQAKLTAFDGAGGDEFGRSVAIDGRLIVVGSELISIDGEASRGAAYVHRWSDIAGMWIQEAKLAVPDGGLPFDQFASSVSIAGDTIALGSPGSDAPIQDQGAIYVFHFDPVTPTFGQWTWAGKLIAPDGAQSDNLGGPSRGTAILGDIIIGGAVGHENIGAAYVFRREFISPQQAPWHFEAKLTPPDGQSSDSFGFSVSHTGGSALIGAPFADDGVVLDRGAGYFFTRSPAGLWRLRQKLVAAGDEPFEGAGRDVALSGTAAMLGRPFAEPGGQSDLGAVSTWSCGDLIFADGGEDSSGCGS